MIAYNFRRKCKESDNILNKLNDEFILNSPIFVKVEPNYVGSFEKSLLIDNNDDNNSMDIKTDLKHDVLSEVPLNYGIETNNDDNLSGLSSNDLPAPERIIKRRRKRRTKEQMLEDKLKKRRRRVRGKDLPALEKMVPHDIYDEFQKSIADCECKICGKKLGDKYSLINHFETHKSEAHYTCNVCDMKLKTFRTYDRHLKTHDVDHCLSCEYCGKLFHEYSQLDIHLKMHKGEKPLHCDICEMRFLRKGALKVRFLYLIGGFYFVIYYVYS